jgi:Tfp pilus assembly protein PilN
MISFARHTPRFMAASIPSRFVFPLLLLAGLAAGLPAIAAEKATRAASAPAPRTSSTSILTPAQLRECVNQKDRLHAQTDDALKDKAVIETDKNEIARTATSLGEELATLDRTSDAAVDAYNTKVEQRDKLIETYQTRVTAYNLKAEAVKATKEGYEKSCENRRYDERDLADVKRKK